MEKELMTLNDFIDICELSADILPVESHRDAKINKISCFKSEISEGDVVIWTGGYRGLREILDIDFLYVFVNEDTKSHYMNNEKIIAIEDPYIAIVKCIDYFRKKLNVKTVVTCGSVHANLLGRLISHVLRYNGFKIYDNGLLSNSNSARFVLSNIQRLRASETDVEVWIQEISGASDGEIRALHRHLTPDMTVLTDIKDSVIKEYSSENEMIKDLLSVCDNKLGNRCYVTAKDLIQYEDCISNAFENCSYIYDENTYVDDIYESNSTIRFNIVDGNDIHTVRVNNLSCIAIDIALTTYVVCRREFNLNASNIIEAIASYTFESHYKYIKRISSAILYLEENVKSYTDAVKAIERFLDIDNRDRKRLAVITDFIRNKERFEIIKDYFNLARLISGKNIDYVISYGNFSEYLSGGIILGNKTRSVHCNSIVELQTWINDHFTEFDDVISISNGDSASESFKSLLGGLDIKSIFPQNNKVPIHRDSFGFNEHKFGMEIFNAPKSLVQFNFNALKFTKEIKSIGNGAFSRCRNLENIDLYDNINYIGSGAFYICPVLKKISLPSNLKIIDDSAFNYCVKLESINIPEGVIHIGRRAFYDCKELTDVYIPGSVKYIGEEAFSNCPNINVCVDNNEYVENYCIENNIQYYVKKRRLF